MKTLNELSKEIYSNAVSKGFYEKPVERGTKLMLVVSELAEALEADRKGNRANLAYFDANIASGHDFEDAFRCDIKDTFEDEIADAIIRLLDLSAAEGIDIERHVELKMQYNSLRPHKHGKKY